MSELRRAAERIIECLDSGPIHELREAQDALRAALSAPDPMPVVEAAVALARELDRPGAPDQGDRCHDVYYAVRAYESEGGDE